MERTWRSSLSSGACTGPELELSADPGGAHARITFVSLMASESALEQRLRRCILAYAALEANGPCHSSGLTLDQGRRRKLAFQRAR